jgi:hypothetical protein
MKKKPDGVNSQAKLANIIQLSACFPMPAFVLQIWPQELSI